MAKIIKKVDINDVIKNTTLYVHIGGTKKFKVKLFIASQLFKLASFVLNCSIEIESEIK